MAFALLDAGVRSLTIANRNAERADALADRIGQPGRVHVRYWNDLATLRAAWDFIINATSAGVQGSVRSTCRSPSSQPRALCYDLSYGRAATAFLAWARTAKAAHVFDGLGMLVEQAAEAFAIWHGVRPDTEAVHAELRERLDAA